MKIELQKEELKLRQIEAQCRLNTLTTTSTRPSSPYRFHSPTASSCKLTYDTEADPRPGNSYTVDCYCIHFIVLFTLSYHYLSIDKSFQ